MSRSVAADARVAILTAVAIARARYVLWRGGFPAAQASYDLAIVTERPTGGEDRRPERLDAATLGVAVRILRLPGLSGACLPTSLALASVLRRLGIDADVVLGVGTGNASEFGAHAWVEAAGRRIDVSRLPPGRYSEIGRFRALSRPVRC